MTRTIIAAAGLLVLSIAAVAYIVALEASENAYVMERIESQDLRGVYSYYLDYDPITGVRAVHGQPEAPLEAVIVIDLTSSESQEAYEEITAYLQEHYISQGRMKLRHKYLITAQDAQQQTERYLASKAAICAQEELIEAHRAIFAGNVSEAECDEQQQLAADISETDTYRIVAPSLHISIAGEDTIILYGNPEPELINQTIRNKEITLGI